MKTRKFSILILCGVITLASVGFIPRPTKAAPRDIVFPVLGRVSYSDSFGAPRSGGRTHEGTDIFGYKGQPLIAAVTGTVRFVAYPQPSYGYYISIEANDGWTYRYLHINNDTPGTDDNNGGEMFAYAPDMRSGNPVEAGQLIGWMGDSGNAEATTAHLHFEIRNPSGQPINPFESLYYARQLGEATFHAPIDDEILPFGRFEGGASIAIAEMNGKYEGEEIIAAAYKGGGPHVKVIAQNGQVITQFFAFEDSMRGGMDVTVADVNGDQSNDIIIAAGEGSSPRVRIFTKRGVLQKEFLAFEDWFKGGVRVSAADLNGDGLAEILTAPAKDYAPWLKIYDGEGRHQREFLAYGKGFKGGFDVAAYGDTSLEDSRIVTGAARGGGPHIQVFDGSGLHKKYFFAYGEGFRGGVRVSVGQVYESTESPEIVVAPQTAGGPDFKIFTLNGTRIKSRTEFERWWRAGYDVAAGTDAWFVASQSKRRTSIRPLQ